MSNALAIRRILEPLAACRLRAMKFEIIFSSASLSGKYKLQAKNLHSQLALLIQSMRVHLIFICGKYPRSCLSFGCGEAALSHPR